MYEKKGHFHVTGGVREIKIGEVLYKVQRTGLFDTVWVITLNQKTCVYRRLAWDIPTQMSLSNVILFSCIIPLGKQIGGLLLGGESFDIRCQENGSLDNPI